MQAESHVGSAQVGVRRMRFDPCSLENLSVRYSALVLYRGQAEISHEIEGKERPKRRFLSGDLMVRPPGLSFSTEYLTPAEVTIFALETETIRSFMSDDSADVSNAMARFEARPFRAPLISSIADRLDTACCEREGQDALYFDALLQALCQELWRLSGNEEPEAQLMGAGLSPKALREINDFIDAEDAAKVDLNRLARVAGMPAAKFSKAIKESQGVTPYQYVLGRRVAKAQNLIETTGFSLAEIAYLCGFSSQSHMTDVFSSRIGTTPAAFRKDRA